MIVQLHVADGGVYGVFILRVRVCVCVLTVDLVLPYCAAAV